MKKYNWLAVLLLLVMAGNVFPADLLVTRSFTGIWNQPDQESQGLDMQVISRADGSNYAVFYWYTYGEDRKSAWYFGRGNIVGDHIDFELFRSDDVGFMQDGVPGNDSVMPIGSMTMTFDDCNNGMVSYESEFDEVGSGSFAIGRLTNVKNMHCSGGISDNMDANSMYGERRIDLAPVRDGINGNGHARFDAYSGHSAFEISTDGLPDGSYHLYVGDDERGTFAVTGGRGGIEFVSPMESNKHLLTFDPRGMQVRIHDQSGMVLSSFDGAFEPESHGHDGDDDHRYDCDNNMGNHGSGSGMGDCVDNGEAIEIEMDMSSTGQVNGAKGEAGWEMTTGHIAFSVEIENVPVGSYPLMVGGEEVGIIQAREMAHSGIFGRIMFRDPQMNGGYHLDFDPRSQTVEVMQQGSVILTVDFPAE